MPYLSCMNEEGTSWSAGPLGEVRGSAYGGQCVKYFPPFKMTMLAHVLKCWRAGESFPFTTQSHAKKKKKNILNTKGSRRSRLGYPCTMQTSVKISCFRADSFHADFMQILQRAEFGCKSLTEYFCSSCAFLRTRC